MGPASCHQSVTPVFEKIGLLVSVREGLVEHGGWNLGPAEVVGKALLEHVDTEQRQAGQSFAREKIGRERPANLIKARGPVALSIETR